MHPDIVLPDERTRWRSSQSSIWELEGPTTDSFAPFVGLFDQPRWLVPYLLYDETGSRLFEKISGLPEYYLTRTEDSILEQQASRVVALAPVELIVELGAGFSKKTIHLLSAQVQQRGGGIFAPVDVSLAGLLASRDMTRESFPELSFQGLQAQFEQAVTGIDRKIAKLFVFLGSTIGNFTQAEFVQFFVHLSRYMGERDFLLLGVDRLKDPDIIEAAYNDAQGLTAAFILNVFEHVNRRVGSNFNTAQMRYESCYNRTMRQVEMRAVATASQEIRFPSHGVSFEWKADESILVEHSRKFDPDDLQKQLRLLGFEPICHLTDSQRWFSLLLFRKKDRAPGAPVAELTAGPGQESDNEKNSRSSPRI